MSKPRMKLLRAGHAAFSLLLLLLGVPRAAGATTVCSIQLADCPNFPNFSGVNSVFSDTYADANTSQSICVTRAHDYYFWCGSASSVLSNFVVNGSMVQTTSYPPVGANRLQTRSVFTQPSIDAVSNFAYVGAHDAKGATYRTGSGVPASLAPGQMALILWADDQVSRLLASSSPSHFTPWTGLAVGDPYGTYQVSVDATWPGDTGFQLYLGEIGMSLHSPSFPINNAYDKGTLVVSYTLPSFAAPFAGRDDDELEWSFRMKIPTGSGSDPEGAGNVYAYFLFDDLEHDHHLCFGGGVFDTRPAEASKPEEIFADPETTCPIVNAHLGASPHYTIDNDQTSAFTTATFSDYRQFRFVINGQSLQRALYDLNVKFPLRGYSLDPAKYSLTDIVLNPEINVNADGGARVSPVPFVDIALAVRDMSVMMRQSQDIKGAVTGFLNTNGTYTIEGWACAFSVPQSTIVQFYRNGTPEQGGVFVSSSTANLPNQGTEDVDCGTTGVPHRFSIPVSASLVTSASQQPIYVMGVSPQGLRSLALKSSGTYLLSSSANSTISYVPLYRFVSGSDRIYATSPTYGIPFGYSFEAGVANISTTGRANYLSLYQCHSGSHHFLSNSSSCEGQTVDFMLGYVEKSPVLGTRPVYRYYSPNTGYYLITTQPTELSGSNYVKDTVFGYVW